MNEPLTNIRFIQGKIAKAITKMTADNSNKMPPALLTIEQTCQLLNISRAEFYRLDASGKFGLLSVGLCRKRLYVKDEILNWIRAGLPHRKQWQTIRREYMK